jgi:GT2 family glycosyltransferase
MTNRPAVSVIVPFAGSREQLDTLVAELERLELGDEDEVVVAVNRPSVGIKPPSGRVQIVDATGLRSPGFARNQAAARAGGEWLLFIDADTRAKTSLLDDLFTPGPAADTGVLAGEIVDAAALDGLVARHAVARRQMSQTNTLSRGGFGYAQTANCAVRADAFAAVGGFDPDARAAEDADLCFRLAAAGWRIEHRRRAEVAHSSRNTIRSWVGQLVRHGAGAAWLERRYPGALPSPGLAALTRRMLANCRDAVRGLSRADPDAVAFALLDLVGALAFESGRLLSNTPRREPGFTEPITGEFIPQRERMN